ncbi:Glucokinase [Hartmannibacter diazotrophicus]|uniref:Glucokinase n=1 Tax=Hartmannibacter diazotrophicus TaxID=1482074 RepID=A0A2C9D3Z5_9HYPH|nr:ROK family protein [Hartmannibacter diazotrophicus]SON54195.1 Glucokinase [Hartmannibacter diazotrophicus]
MPGTVDAFHFPVLFADIGGTNARFAVLEHPGAQPYYFEHIKTKDYETVADALATAILPQAGTPPRTLMFAVAAPIGKDRTPLTNSHWVVEPMALIERFGLAQVMLFNDFEALALALPTLTLDDIDPIGTAAAPALDNKVVVGPGTGLGAGGLVRAGGSWVPVAGEGGHIDLAPVSDRDFAIWPQIERLDGSFEGRVSAETLVCGSGLVRLYQAICRTDGLPMPHPDPAGVTAAAEANDPAAREAMELFAVHLGRTAGNLALVFLAHGGVYLAGGIAPRIAPILKSGGFRAAFEDKVPHSAMLSTMPTGIITHSRPALAGLIGYARSPGNFLLDVHDRLWG